MGHQAYTYQVPYTVYILRTSRNTLYTGQTKDLALRLKHHQSKSAKGAKYVRSFADFKLVYTEQFSTRSEALKREYELKQLSKKRKEALISYTFPMHIGIVLGYGLFEEPNQEYKDYLDWISAEVKENNIQRIIICGGHTNKLKPDLSEAQTIQQYLINKLPTTQFLLEDKSLTTNQNLENAKSLIDPEAKLTIWCDQIRMAKVIWIALHFLLKLKKPQISRTIFEFIKDRKIKSFIYQKLTVKGFDFPASDKEQAILQSFASILDVESLYDEELNEMLTAERKKNFGL